MRVHNSAAAGLPAHRTPDGSNGGPEGFEVVGVGNDIQGNPACPQLRDRGGRADAVRRDQPSRCHGQNALRAHRRNVADLRQRRDLRRKRARLVHCHHRLPGPYGKDDLGHRSPEGHNALARGAQGGEGKEADKGDERNKMGTMFRSGRKDTGERVTTKPTQKGRTLRACQRCPFWP